MISAKARVAAAFVHAAPVLVGVPFFLWVFSYAGMLVFFAPGVFMAVAGLIVALVARRCAPPGFVRTEAAGALHFHSITALVGIVVLVLVFVAVFAGGIMAAASIGATLLGVVLPLVEIGRALAYGIGALRATATVLPER